MFDPTDEEDAGRWKLKGQAASLGNGETWPLGWGEVKFNGRFTSYTWQLFPEQAAGRQEWLDATGLPELQATWPKISTCSATRSRAW